MSKLRQAAVRAYVGFSNAVIGPIFGTRCPVCGRRTMHRRRSTLHPNLIKDWKLSADWERWINAREFDYCLGCGATRRDQSFASALVEWASSRLGQTFTTLAEVVASPGFRELKIAEINSIGSLHHWFANHPNLRYSEFGSTDPLIANENILALSYADQSFDLVITSETLEHVPDFPATQREIYRVLKPGGTHVFTIPVIWDRPATLQRASIVDGQVVHYASPSYHGSYEDQQPDWLVFYEFGRDVTEQIQQAGFQLTIHRDALNPALIAFEATRPTN